MLLGGLEPGQERPQLVGHHRGFNFCATLCGVLNPESRNPLSGDPQASSKICEAELLLALDEAGTARYRCAGANLAAAVAVWVGSLARHNEILAVGLVSVQPLFSCCASSVPKGKQDQGKLSEEGDYH